MMINQRVAGDECAPSKDRGNTLECTSILLYLALPDTGITNLLSISDFLHPQAILLFTNDYQLESLGFQIFSVIQSIKTISVRNYKLFILVGNT